MDYHDVAFGIFVHALGYHAESVEDGKDSLCVDGEGIAVADGHAEGGGEDLVGEGFGEGVEDLRDREGGVAGEEGADGGGADGRGVFFSLGGSVDRG